MSCWKSVTECTSHREEVTFNHVLWAPLQGKWSRMTQELEIQAQSRDNGKETSCLLP